MPVRVRDRLTWSWAKNDRLLGLLTRVRARTYVSGAAAGDYLSEKRCREAGIELVWEDSERLRRRGRELAVARSSMSRMVDVIEAWLDQMASRQLTGVGP